MNYLVLFIIIIFTIYLFFFMNKKKQILNESFENIDNLEKEDIKNILIKAFETNTINLRFIKNNNKVYYFKNKERKNSTDYVAIRVNLSQGKMNGYLISSKIDKLDVNTAIKNMSIPLEYLINKNENKKGFQGDRNYWFIHSQNSFEKACLKLVDDLNTQGYEFFKMTNKIYN